MHNKDFKKNNVHILIIDDDEKIRLLLKQFLEICTMILFWIKLARYVIVLAVYKKFKEYKLLFP